MTETPDDRISKYLSTEWAVTNETLHDLEAIAGGLVQAVKLSFEKIDAARGSGDVHALSAAVAMLSELLRLVRPALERAESNAYAHYVELLGSREAVEDMARALIEFFERSPERDELKDKIGSRFDKMLLDLDNEDPL